MTAMRCACYARYSSDLQRETSIDDQVAVARQYAERQGWTLIDQHIYSDKGITGASLEGRPGIQALLTAAATTPPPFDVLLVDDTSRFARDTADAIRAVQQLTFCGVRIVFISQGLDTASDQAETLVAVHGVVDQLYIRELKHKIKRGIRGQLWRGFHTGAKTYGYRSAPVYDPSGRRDGDGPVVIGKRREIDPEQAAVVRQIYREYVDGLSQPTIMDHLNREQIPSPRGTPWTKPHIDRMLRNERYLGKQIWGQTTYERRPGTNSVVARKQPREEWHVLDRPDLRIVDDDLWEQVRTRRAAIKRTLNIEASGLARGRSGLYSKYLLVGLARCGVCGKRFTIVSSGNRSPRYGCPSSWRNGMASCDNRLTIMAKVADPVVLGGLQDQLLEPNMVQSITNAVTEGVRKALCGVSMSNSPSRPCATKRSRSSRLKDLATSTHCAAHATSPVWFGHMPK